jgi:hypothetical protein
VRQRVAEIVARKSQSGEPIDPREVLREAEELESPFHKGLKAALHEILPQISYRLETVDPFHGGGRFTDSNPVMAGGPKGGDASAKQKKLISALAPTPYADEFYEKLGRGQAGAVITKLMAEPCRPWILRKLPGKNPKTNKEGLAMLKEKR